MSRRLVLICNTSANSSTKKKRLSFSDMNDGVGATVEYTK